MPNGCLAYTAAPAFNRAEATAWWTCHATLLQINSELASVDALLRNTRRPTLAARSVAGIESPIYLREYVPTIGWIPVSTRLHVSDVPSLVERLGGAQLYGDDPSIVLRELIQNAADAVRARRHLQPRYEGGRIEVELGADEHGAWLEVGDTGVGMSDAVLTGSLLDFGASYWTSELALRECPGLAASGFDPNGTYGIGFYSVFMLSTEITVRTRTWTEGVVGTKILEFVESGGKQPLLRSADESEWLLEPGTRIRLRLREARSVADAHRRLNLERGTRRLARMCREICLGCGVDLFVKEGPNDEYTLAVPHDNWKSAPADSLLVDAVPASIHEILARPENADASRSFTHIARRLSPIVEADGRVVGRAAIASGLRYRRGASDVELPLGCAVMGGMVLRAKFMSIAGMLESRPIRAARDLALPVASTDAMKRWASAQARMLAAEPLSDGERLRISEIVLGFGGDAGPMPIALGPNGWLTQADLERPTQSRRTVVVAIAGTDLKGQELPRPPEGFLIVESNGYVPPDKHAPSGRFTFLAAGLTSSNGEPEAPLRLELSYGASSAKKWAHEPDSQDWLQLVGKLVLRSLSIAWQVPNSSIRVTLGDGRRWPTYSFPQRYSLP